MEADPRILNPPVIRTNFRVEGQEHAKTTIFSLFSSPYYFQCQRLSSSCADEVTFGKEHTSTKPRGERAQSMPTSPYPHTPTHALPANQHNSCAHDAAVERVTAIPAVRTLQWSVPRSVPTNRHNV